MNEENLPIEAVDYLMIKWKKLASWENPRYSGTAVLIVSIAYWYLNWTDSTTLNLTLWAALAVFLSMSFAQTIWPEISYEPKITIDSGEGDDGIPESEISFMVEETKNYFTILKDLRKDSPGLFCLFSSGVFILLSYFGSYITLLPLMYCVMIGGLVLPLTFRKLKKESPWIMEKMEKFNIMVLFVLKNVLKSLKIRIEKWGNATLTSINRYVTLIREHSKRYADQIARIEVKKIKSPSKANDETIENINAMLDESTYSVEKISDTNENTYSVEKIPENIENSYNVEKISQNHEKVAEEE